MPKRDDTFVQGGAQFTVKAGGKRTKAALKAAVKERPEKVTLYSTSHMGPQFNGPASDLGFGITFTVVGPDPYSARDWFASVYRNQRGGLTVK